MVLASSRLRSDAASCFIDLKLNFANHIKYLAGRCFYPLCQFRVFHRSLTTISAKMLMHAFISSRADYSSSVFNHVCAVHLIYCSRLLMHQPDWSYANISTIISQSDLRDMLHWLSIEFHVEYKLCLLVYKSLHQLAPPYLFGVDHDSHSCSGQRHMHSATHGDIGVPRTRTSHYGLRSFAVSGPSSWNSLPADIHDVTLTVNQ